MPEDPDIRAMICAEQIVAFMQSGNEPQAVDLAMLAMDAVRGNDLSRKTLTALAYEVTRLRAELYADAPGEYTRARLVKYHQMLMDQAQ